LRGRCIVVKREAKQRAIASLESGAVASVLSALVAVAASAISHGRPAAAINGPSQWLLGRLAIRRRKASWRHTLPGYLIHHASSLFWACVHESAPVRRYLPRPLSRAAAVAALAAFVDYAIIPRRFSPGFEGQLSRTQIAATYVAFAIGLVLASPRRDALRSSRAARGHARRGR
jgi:hypothetical protein